MMSESGKLKEEFRLLKEKIDSYEEAPVFWEPKNNDESLAIFEKAY